MFLSPKDRFVALFALAFTLVGASMARADEPAPLKDDALDRLLEKLDKPDATAKPKPKPDAADTKPETTTAKDANARPDAEKPKPSGDLAPKDRALDNLL